MAQILLYVSVLRRLLRLSKAYVRLHADVSLTTMSRQTHTQLPQVRVGSKQGGVGASPLRVSDC